MNKKDYDVCVIGGGPGGATAASYLAKAGLRVAVFERDVFPRQHVGESFVPATTRVFKELNFLPKMEEYKFPHKFGAVWTSAMGKNYYDHNWDGMCVADDPLGTAPIAFGERMQPGVDTDYTYHVDRGLFDALWLRHSAELGASVFQGAKVEKVDFPGEGAIVHVVVGDKKLQYTCNVVVDASGRQTLLGRQQGLKVTDKVFDQYALHTWFDKYDRSAAGSPEKKDYIYIHFLPVNNTWVWQIPINDTVTSIGVVTQKKNFAKDKKSREDFYWECLKTRPEIYNALKAAEQMRPLKEEGDYSYAMSQICGDNFVLIGDAARFVDPIFSSGVSIALNSGRLCAADIIKAHKTGDFSKKAYEEFQSIIRRGTRNWYEFINLYYRLNVMFTALIRDPRYRLDILKLLQGDLYDEDAPPVLVKMREIVTQVESNERHPWHQLLGDLTSNAFAPTF